MKSTNQKKGVNVCGILSEKASELFDSMYELQKRGVLAEHAAMLRQKDKWPEYADFIAECMKRGYVAEEPDKHKKMRKLFGNRNYVGIEEWRNFGAIFTKVDFEKIVSLPIDSHILNSRCPFDSTGRRSIHQTHVIFLGLKTYNGSPLTISKMASLNERRGNRLHVKTIPGEDYAEKETCNFCWYIAPKEYIWCSINIPSYDYEVMATALRSKAPEYELSLPVEEVVKHSIFFQKNKKIIFTGNTWLPDVSHSKGKWKLHIEQNESNKIDLAYMNSNAVKHTQMGIALVRKLS